MWKTPDEMSTEAQAALNKISQPQVPEQVERDGFESQLELAVSSGTVHPKSALGQKFTRSLGEDEKQAIKHDDAFCWIGYSVIECFGTAHVSQNPKHRDLPDIHELRWSSQQFVATHCEAYGRCKGWGAKASLRAESAKSALSNLQTSKQHSKSYQEFEVSRGTYLSFIKIWDEEGQDQDGFNAAMLYCARAKKLLRQEFMETLFEK